MINNADYETEKNIKKYFDIPIKYCKFVLLIFYNLFYCLCILRII